MRSLFAQIVKKNKLPKWIWFEIIDFADLEFYFSPNVCKVSKYKALFEKACNESNYEFIEFFESKFSCKNIGLFIAARDYKTKLVKYFLKKGGDPDALHAGLLYTQFCNNENYDGFDEIAIEKCLPYNQDYFSTRLRFLTYFVKNIDDVLIYVKDFYCVCDMRPSCSYCTGNLREIMIGACCKGNISNVKKILEFAHENFLKPSAHIGLYYAIKFKKQELVTYLQKLGIILPHSLQTLLEICLSLQKSHTSN